VTATERKISCAGGQASIASSFEITSPAHNAISSIVDAGAHLLSASLYPGPLVCLMKYIWAAAAVLDVRAALRRKPARGKALKANYVHICRGENINSGEMCTDNETPNNQSAYKSASSVRRQQYEEANSTPENRAVCGLAPFIRARLSPSARAGPYPLLTAASRHRSVAQTVSRCHLKPSADRGSGESLRVGGEHRVALLAE